MNSIEVYTLSDAALWDETVRSFPCYDVYYLSGYVEPFRLHGDGEPQLLYYSKEGLRAIYAYMKRPIDDEHFDIITPYGYGGFLFDGVVTEEHLADLKAEWCVYMNKCHCVSNFVRCHPLLTDLDSMRQFLTVVELGKTIAMDLSTKEKIWDNISGKNRNMIRKAKKNGITIAHGKGMELFDAFIPIYNATMDKDNVSAYYYFGRSFYESIHRELHDNYELFYASLDGQIIAMSIILYANGLMHYHLSGSLSEFRHLAPTNLLLYEAAIWGCEQGFRQFHLGGGVGSQEDSLYKFKEGFNRNSDCRFAIAKQILIPEVYNKLVDVRTQNDSSFDASSGFFPLYRA